MIRHDDFRVRMSGGDLFVRRWLPAGAQGSPIVLFHDSLGSVELWRDFPAALAARVGRAVFAYDRLGFGRSGPRADALGPGFVAEEAETAFPALCAQLGIGRFIVFGHSVGGGMAAHCAARFAQACDALITESAQAFVEDRTLHGIRAARAAFADPVQVERLAKYHGAQTRWVLDAWIDTWLAPSFADWSLDAVLPRVRCPVLALHGADDEYGSPRHPERIARMAGGPVRVEMMSDTRHVPHREREATVLDCVAEFLRTLG